MKRENWIWMPHAAHFCMGHYCRFHLATYVGGYIVSTVGEYWPDASIRRIHAMCHDKDWFEEHEDLKGDDFDHAYMKKFGFEDIGVMYKFETMVFKAKKQTEKDHLCCPWIIDVRQSKEQDGYKTKVEATKGHMALCEKYSRMK